MCYVLLLGTKVRCGCAWWTDHPPSTSWVVVDDSVAHFLARGNVTQTRWMCHLTLNWWIPLFPSPIPSPFFLPFFYYFLIFHTCHTLFFLRRPLLPRYQRSVRHCVASHAVWRLYSWTIDRYRSHSDHGRDVGTTLYSTSMVKKFEIVPII